MPRVLSRSLLALIALAPLAHAKIVSQPVDYTDESGAAFQGIAVFDDEVRSPRPGVLLVHDWRGLSDYSQKRAEMLAQLGYLAFQVDVYGKGVHLTTPQQWMEQVTKFKADRNLYRERERAAYEAMRKMAEVDPDKIAAIGYCFGGTGVIEMARDGLPLKGVVCFHGDLDSQPVTAGKRIQAKVLALCGADDPFQKPANLAAFDQQMRELGVDYEIVQYGHAQHAFTEADVDALNMKGAKYNEAADKRSWQAMVDFLKEVFAPAAGSGA